jgi:hypothetical protein
MQIKELLRIESYSKNFVIQLPYLMGNKHHHENNFRTLKTNKDVNMRLSGILARQKGFVNITFMGVG